MGRPKKYKTEEERKAAVKAYNAAYKAAHKEEIAAKMAEYRTEHKDEIAAKRAEYYANHKKEIAAKQAEYYANHKDEIAAKYAEYWTEYYQKNKNEIKKKVSEWNKKNKEHRKDYMRKYQETNKDKLTKYYFQYHSDYVLTPKGRANFLLQSYRAKDKLYNRGECTLTDDWIVDNVFSGQVCHYCGETDWTKLGVDRKDSSLSHTPENCVPCCKVCNTKKHTTPYDDFMRRIGKIA